MLAIEWNGQTINGDQSSYFVADVKSPTLLWNQ